MPWFPFLPQTTRIITGAINDCILCCDDVYTVEDCWEPQSPATTFQDGDNGTRLDVVVGPVTLQTPGPHNTSVWDFANSLAGTKLTATPSIFQPGSPSTGWTMSFWIAVSQGLRNNTVINVHSPGNPNLFSIFMGTGHPLNNGSSPFFNVRMSAQDLCDHDGVNLDWGIDFTDPPFETSSAAFHLANWYFMCIRWRASGEVTFDWGEDGDVATTKRTENVETSLRCVPDSYIFSLGHDFVGYMDEFCLWPCVLTDSQVNDKLQKMDVSCS